MPSLHSPTFLQRLDNPGQAPEASGLSCRLIFCQLPWAPHLLSPSQPPALLSGPGSYSALKKAQSSVTPMSDPSLCQHPHREVIIPSSVFQEPKPFMPFNPFPSRWAGGPCGVRVSAPYLCDGRSFMVPSSAPRLCPRDCI